MRAVPVILLVLTACAAGSIKTDDDGDAGSEGTTGPTNIGSDDDTDTDTDTGEEADTAPPEPSIEDWEGDWVGELTITSVGEEVYGWDDCLGTLEIDVDLDGEADGDGTCSALESDWGDPEEYEVEFEGLMDAEGNLTGTLIVDAGGWGDVSMTVDTLAEPEALGGEASGETTYDGWGTEYTLSLEAAFALERD